MSNSRDHTPPPTAYHAQIVDLRKDLDATVASALEGAFERFASEGPRILRLKGGTFTVSQGPKDDV